jgi:hypothetical protein
MLSDTDTFVVTPLDGRSARRREMNLRNNTQHSQDTNDCTPARFDFAIPANERPQTYVIDRGVVGMASFTSRLEKFTFSFSLSD